MVLAEKSNEEQKGGRRSRGPSPNGHLSDDGSATDDSDHEDNGMRVGEEYQAKIPDILLPSSKDQYISVAPDKALLVWSPIIDVSETKLDEFISVSKEKYGYNSEQALGMLFWHKHDLEKAIIDLPNFTPFPDEWSVEDKVLFEQAFQFHGKSFHRIRQMLPDKSISTLIRYYYSWKKTRCRTSLMDRQARKLATQREDGRPYQILFGRDRRQKYSMIEAASDAGSNSESDAEGVEKKEKVEGVPVKTICSNCSASCYQAFPSTKGSLCTPCSQYFRRTGVMRPTSGSLKRLDMKDRNNSLKNRKKPPRGMYLSYEDLVAIVTAPQSQDDVVLKGLDSEVVSLKRQVQNNKQLISALKHKTHAGIGDLKQSEKPNRIIATWTNDELLLAVQGIRKYGKDFKAIAEVLGTKTEAHMRSYFINYRRRYNLDAVIQEYEAEQGPIKEEDKDEKLQDMDFEAADTSTPESSPPTTQPANTPTDVTAQSGPPAVASSAPLNTTQVPAPIKRSQPRPSILARPMQASPSNRLPGLRIGSPQSPQQLIRPNTVPIMATMKPHQNTHTQPQQLMTRE